MDQQLPATEITALLGRGTQFEGKLHFEGRVRIDGVFKGEIQSDDTLIIGGGTVHGNIRARNSIEVHAPGKIMGNLHSPSVFIDRGVEFQGSCRMDPVEDRAAPEKSAEKPAREGREGAKVPP